LVLTIGPQNQKSSAIQLLKPFIFDHPAVLAGGFADMAATWRRVHVSASSLSSHFSSLLPSPPLPSLTGNKGQRRLRRRCDARVGEVVSWEGARRGGAGAERGARRVEGVEDSPPRRGGSAAVEGGSR
jgi:hypothetical protein